MISRIPLLLFRRSISTSAPRKDSIFTRIREFVYAGEKENFDKDLVARAYKWDNISRQEWKLIHRDLNASRIFVYFSLCVPPSIIGAVVMAVDIIIRKEQERFSFSRRLRRDFKDLGYFIIFPILGIITSIIFLLRIHSIRILRIYQNRTKIDEYIAIRPKFLVGQEQAKFHKDTTSAFYYDENKHIQSFMLSALFGNVQIGNRKHIVLDECFLGNNYRSYMLNETSVPPLLTNPPPKQK